MGKIYAQINVGEFAFSEVVMSNSPFEVFFKGMPVELVSIAALLRVKFDNEGMGTVYSCFSSHYFSFKMLAREVARLQTIIIRPNKYVVVECGPSRVSTDGKLSIFVESANLIDWVCFSEVDIAVPDFEDVVWEQCVNAAEVSEEWCRNRMRIGKRVKRR